MVAAADPPPAVCQGRSPCTERSRQDAGKGDSGAALSVVHVQLGPHPDVADEFDACMREEHWLLAAGRAPRLLLEVCNDGYGASGVGDDSITVKDNRFVHRRYGGSSWRWANQTTLHLDPLQIRSTRTNSFHAAAPDHFRHDETNYTTGALTTEWGSPVCDYTGRFDRIPMVKGLSVPATARLGSCAAQARADGSRGYVTFGAPAASGADAGMWAVMTDETTLIIEVADDRWITEADSWLYEDHLELWVSMDDVDQHYGWACETHPAAQWAIRLNGAVVPAHQASGPPPAARVASGPDGRRRVQVTLPAAPKGLTVVYSDSDDGQRQERLIATSALTFNVQASLGEMEAVAACAVRDGLLEMQPATPPPTGAVIHP